MPQGIPIQAIPNQSFSISLEQNQYDIEIRYTNGCMSVSISLNGTTLVENLRAAACTPLLPAQYQEEGQGNFMFLTASEQLPNWQQFNATQQLFYFSASELAVFRTAPVAASRYVPTVTAASFNPIGGLPLRFSPTGYVAG